MTRGSLMVDVGGLTLTAEDKEVLAHPDVGSVILFSRNVDTPTQIAELTADLDGKANGGAIEAYR